MFGVQDYAVTVTARGMSMGRIGKSYPRFEQAPQSPAPTENERLSVQVVGAIIGVLCALGFIGWLLAR